MRATLLALLLTSVTVLPSYAKPILKWDPPAKYDHEYPGGLIITVLPGATISKLCSLMSGNPKEVPACSTWNKDMRACHVFIPAVGDAAGFEVDKAGQELLFSHEMGHCNGWPSNHPGVVNPFTGKVPEALPQK